MKIRQIGRFWKRRLLVLGPDGSPLALFTGRTEAERSQALAEWLIVQMSWRGT